MKIAAVVALVVLLLAVGPLLVIWSVNTLFGLGIPYTFKTWLAMGILGLAVGGPAARPKSDR